MCDLNSEDVVAMKIFLSWVKPKVLDKEAPHIDIQKPSKGLTPSCKHIDKSIVTELLCYKATGVSQDKKNNCISFNLCFIDWGIYSKSYVCICVWWRLGYLQTGGQSKCLVLSRSTCFLFVFEIKSLKEPRACYFGRAGEPMNLLVSFP